MSRISLIIFSAVAIALSLAASSAHATVVNLHADFDGLQMVPPNASPAFGVAEATFDDSTGQLTITSGTYQDLFGGANQVFLNDAAIGSNGPFIMNLTLDTPGAASGTFSGGGLVGGGNIADMLAGQGYIRVTSSALPGGEIRGQLLPVPVPEPATCVLALFGVAALFGIARGTRRKRRG